MNRNHKLLKINRRPMDDLTDDEYDLKDEDNRDLQYAQLIQKRANFLRLNDGEESNKSSQKISTKKAAFADDALDKLNCIQLINKMYSCIDSRNWKSLQEKFAFKVDKQYSNEKDEIDTKFNLSPNEMTKECSMMISGFDSTQHAVSNHLISFDSVDSDNIMYRKFKDDQNSAKIQRVAVVRYEVIGHYQLDDRWCIAGFDSESILIKAKSLDNNSCYEWKMRSHSIKTKWKKGDKNLWMIALYKLKSKTTTNLSTLFM